MTILTKVFLSILLSACLVASSGSTFAVENAGSAFNQRRLCISLLEQPLFRGIEAFADLGSGIFVVARLTGRTGEGDTYELQRLALSGTGLSFEPLAVLEVPQKYLVGSLHLRAADPGDRGRAQSASFAANFTFDGGEYGYNYLFDASGKLLTPEPVFFEL